MDARRRFTLQFQQWKARRSDGAEASGSTDINLNRTTSPLTGIEFHVNVTIPPADVVVVPPVKPGPGPA
jgi:hypothetical protein